MTARFFWNEEDKRGHRPRLQCRPSVSRSFATPWTVGAMARSAKYVGNVSLLFRFNLLAQFLFLLSEFAGGVAGSEVLGFENLPDL